MKSSIAMVFITLLATAVPPAAVGADKLKSDGKAKESKGAQKPGRSGSLFDETRKYLADNAARTGEIIKKNAAKLSRSVPSDPPSSKGKKGPAKKEVKGSISRPGKSAR